MANLVTHVAIYTGVVLTLLIWLELRRIHRRLNAWAKSVQILAEQDDDLPE